MVNTLKCINNDFVPCDATAICVAAVVQHTVTDVHILYILVVPSYRLSSYGRRAFSVVGPTMWNSLPKQLRDPVHTTSIFARLLKTFLFSEY